MVEVAETNSLKQFTVTTPDVQSALAIRLWFNGSILDSANNGKYTINLAESQTTVSIMDVSVADSGIYQLEIIKGTESAFSADVYNIELTVTGNEWYHND